MHRLVLGILAFGLVLLGGPVQAQDTGTHSVTVEVDQVDRIDTETPPPEDVVVQAGSDKTMEATMGLKTNAPPSNPRKVQVSLDEDLPQGIILEVRIKGETDYYSLSKTSTTLLSGYSSETSSKDLEYKVTVKPSVRVDETVAGVTYTLQAE